MTRPLRNVTASVHARLNNLARDRRESFNFLLQRYTLERLLYRLGESAHSHRFILKGAMLFALWDENPYRATRDMDLLGLDESSTDQLTEIFREICRLEVDNDGLVFKADTVVATRIREDLAPGGVRIQFTALLGNARINVQADVGFGDVVTPEAQEVEYPTLLHLPAPRLRAYPPETLIAEKFQAMVALGTANSRMKDFYDLWVLARRFSFQGETLARAIYATFECRRTKIPGDVPAGLTSNFLEEKDRSAWRAFFRKGTFTEIYRPFPEVGELLRSFLVPVSRALANGEGFTRTWPAGGPWEPLGTR